MTTPIQRATTRPTGLQRNSSDMSFERYSRASSAIVPLSKSPFKPKFSPDLKRSSFGTVGTDAYTLNEEPPQAGGSSKGPDGMSRGGVERAAMADDKPTGINDSSNEEFEDKAIGERPPSWLETSGDLAWTATFASLTSNTEISSSEGMLSYAVLFAISWQLWASQLEYELKFFTNDWFHRMCFVVQLIIYGVLAAFTNKFDVFWHLRSDDGNEDITEAGSQLYLSPDAVSKQEEHVKLITFRGLALVLALSRLFIFLQYARVLIYRQFHGVQWTKFLYAPIALALSSGIYVACYIVLRVREPGRSTSIIQLALWTMAFIVEVAGHWFNPDDEPNNLIGYGSLTDRLGSVTVIILGEGIVGLFDTFRFSVGAPGFGWRTRIQILAVGSILYFFWLMYFGGYRNRRLPDHKNAILYIYLHLLFLLAVILILQGIKNVLLYTNLQAGYSALQEKVFDNPDFFNFANNEDISRILQTLGISWDAEVTFLKQKMAISLDQANIEHTRFWLSITYRLYATFVKDIDPETTAQYVQYLTYDPIVVQDITATPGIATHASGIINLLDEPLRDVVTWLNPVAGAILVVLALLNYLQENPRHRDMWDRASFLLKVAGGIILALTTIFHAKYPFRLTSRTGVAWTLPIIAIVFVTVCIVDTLVLYASIRVKPDPNSNATVAAAPIKKDDAESFSPPQEKNFGAEQVATEALVTDTK